MAATMAEAGGPGRPARVLVVDDNRVVGKALDLLLRQAGYEAAWAEDGARAGQLLAEFRPDALLLDFDLPDISGLDLLRRMAPPRPVVLVLTAHSFEDIGEELRRAGARDVCSKPISRSTLLEKLRQYGVIPVLPAGGA